MIGWHKDHYSAGYYLDRSSVLGTYFPVRKHGDVQLRSACSGQYSPSRKEGSVLESWFCRYIIKLCCFSNCSGINQSSSDKPFSELLKEQLSACNCFSSLCTARDYRLP
jgi:hypothetical protein